MACFSLTSLLYYYVQYFSARSTGSQSLTNTYSVKSLSWDVLFMIKRYNVVFPIAVPFSPINIVSQNTSPASLPW